MAKTMITQTVAQDYQATKDFKVLRGQMYQLIQGHQKQVHFLGEYVQLRRKLTRMFRKS